MALKHYAEFFYPGIILAESMCEEIKERKPECIKIPGNSYGFRFFDREEYECNGERLVGEKKNISANYLVGRKMTLEQVMEEFPEKEVLILNMQTNHYDSVIITEFGQAIPFRENDVVI